MPPPFPYTFYACPCTESSITEDNNDVLPQDNSTFNPHDPKSAYSLYTLEYLLFCDECNQIKCSRCVSDEIVNWYCPNCLFEVPTSGVKSDGNRCSRNCYSCPVCTAPLTVAQLDANDGESGEETYILQCNYCAWSSLDIDLRFNRPTKITDQINKAHKARYVADTEQEQKQMPSDQRHEKLTAFYKEQLVEAGEAPNALGYGSYGSPANLARIINLYGGLSHNALKKTQEKPRPMREAKLEEGLKSYDVEEDDEAMIDRLARLGWKGTASQAQQQSAPINFDVAKVDDLWPVAIHLRTKRGKRCRTCRQFVVRPDAKIASTRYRVRLIAINHIPRLSIRPLDDRVVTNPAFILRNDKAVQQALLQPHIPLQYLLTLRNPIFETVKVTLATSAITPGRVASRVTILCPSFTIGPAGDVWDDALHHSTASDGSRMAAMASLTGGETDKQPEAGKVWEQTRNSTSVVLEIIPGMLPEDLRDGDDVLEIPVYVRVEWTAEVNTEGDQKGERVPKELAYWTVLGIGQIKTS